MTDQVIEDEMVREVSGATSPRATFRRLLFCGLTPEQAGNLAARLEGIKPIRDGWRVTEIERLIFLRWLVARGHLTDDDAPADAGGWLAEAATTA